MRRRAAALAALGLVAYAVFLVAMLPARFVAAHVTLPPGLSAANVDGSVWSGRANVAYASGASVDVAWHFRPWALFAARIAYDVEAKGSGLDAHARLSRGLAQWAVENLEAQGDAAVIASFVPLASAWQPAGRVQASAARLAWNGRELTGTGDVRWLEASLALAPVRPLGSYTLHVEGDGGPARLRVATTQGVLRVAGEGTLEAPGRVTFNGEVRAEGPDAPSLSALLDLLGPRRADGSHALRLAS